MRDIAVSGVDRIGDTCGGSEICISEAQRQLPVPAQIVFQRAFDDSSVRDIASGREVFLGTVIPALNDEPTRRHRALRDGVDITISGTQRRL